MQVLYWLEKLRMPGLNEFMLLVTRLGEETAFLAAALIVFWCVDKRKGYFLMAVGFIGTMLGQFLKLLFRVPRPWVLDESFTILEQAREAAAGYSFPSGHSLTAVGTFGAVAAVSEKKWIRNACVGIAVLVPFSRMYLGVHTPADVLVGSGIAVGLIFLLRPMAGEDQPKRMKGILGVMLCMALGLLVFVSYWPFPLNIDGHNLESGLKNGYTMLGCTAGVAVVYPLEKKYVNFETGACWWAQVLKVLLGLAAVLLVKEGLRGPLEAMLPYAMARAVRYFLVVIVVGLVWPISFRWFSKLGERK